MCVLSAEWKKFITFRELYAALILAVCLTLWGTIPYARDPSGFWINVYNFNVNIASILILFLQVAGLSRLFCCERAGRTDALIRVGQLGLRGTFAPKLALGLGYGAASSLFPGLLAFCLNALLCGGVPAPFGAGNSVSRIPLWETTGPLALWGWEMLFSLLGGLCAAGLVLLCSALAHRPAAAMAGAALCLALPAAFQVGLVSLFSRFLLPEGLAVIAEGLYRLSSCAWSGILSYDAQLLGGDGAPLWRPILYCLCLLGAELALTWAVWSRRARK